MAVLLIIVSLGLLLMGGFALRRMDAFLDGGGIADSPEGRMNRGVLVYGAPDALALLEKAGIRCGPLASGRFPEGDLYAAFFVLSHNDRENLALVSAAKRADPGIYILARCVAPDLRGVYEAAGAGRILGADESVDALIYELRGIVQ